MRLTCSILPLLSVVFSLHASGQTAVEIAIDFEKQKIAAIEEYVASNPEASDVDRAYSILVESEKLLGNHEKVLDVLEKRYQLAPKGTEALLGTLIDDIGRPFIETCILIGEKGRGREFIGRLKKDLEPHPEAGEINGYIDQIAADLYIPGIGDSMDDLAFKATNGIEVDMKKMRDKVVLVHFWATWSGACIQEMPDIIVAYNQFRDKGFEVIGVSLDDDLAALEKFMVANGIVWPQHFDGKSWGNQMAGKYGIKGIPATFLVGKDGKIVATYLRGAQLEAAIRKELGIEEGGQ